MYDPFEDFGANNIFLGKDIVRSIFKIEQAAWQPQTSIASMVHDVCLTFAKCHHACHEQRAQSFATSLCAEVVNLMGRMIVTCLWALLKLAKM